MNKKPYPHEMTFKELILLLFFIILIGAFFFVVREDRLSKLIVFLVILFYIIYFIYVYRKEKKADNVASQKKTEFISGDYFNSPEWHEKYTAYINEHPFNRPVVSDMKKDLLRRFRRRKELMWSLFFLCLMVGIGYLFLYGNSIDANYIYGNPILFLLAIFVIGVMFFMTFSEYVGMPVRKCLRGDIDYNELNRSYVNSRMLTYKKNGFAFGTTHIHAYTEKKIYNIDYRHAEGITRKIVRTKNYEDGIYSSEEYQHYAVIQVKLPESGQLHHVEIELNEFQVQMVIDNFVKYKTYVPFDHKEIKLEGMDSHRAPA